MLRLETDRPRAVWPLLKDRDSGDVMDSHIVVSRIRGGGDDGVRGRLRSGEADSTLHIWKGVSLPKSEASCTAPALRAFALTQQ